MAHPTVTQGFLIEGEFTTADARQLLACLRDIESRHPGAHFHVKVLRSAQTEEEVKRWLSEVWPAKQGYGREEITIKREVKES